MLEKLVIIAMNPLMCYLIIEVSYIEPLLIIKLIFLGIEFKIFGEVSFASDGTAKPIGKIRPDQHVPRQSKNLTSDTSKNHCQNYKTYENWYKSDVCLTDYHYRFKIQLVRHIRS